MKFILESEYKPSGDQPEAIRELVSALQSGVSDVTLLGVTGSGKTFTMANVIEQLQRPALILSHNKTLAAQLYGEFKSFFPTNAVEYFVSYYDYYQPEAYVPQTDTFIEKDSSINEEVEKLRHARHHALRPFVSLHCPHLPFGQSLCTRSARFACPTRGKFRRRDA